MKKTISLAAVALCLLCLYTGASALAAETVAVAGVQGTINAPKYPSRVVIMDFGILDTLYAMETMGVLRGEVKVALPKGNIPAYLSRYNSEEYANIGSLKEFNLETVYGFKPDLIIISGRQQDYYRELSAIAPVWQMDNQPKDYLGGAMENIRTMGKIFGAEEAVGKSLAGLEADILRAREIASAKGLKALILLTNDGKISVYGSGSRFGIIHDALGVGQADPSIKVGIHGQQVNYEYIAQKDPDIIFVIDRSVAVTGKADGVRILNNDLVNGTKAAKSGRIIPLDPNIWYLSGGGLMSLRIAVDEVMAALEK